MSRLTTRLSLFRSMSASCRRSVGAPISTGIVVAVPYIGCMGSL